MRIYFDESGATGTNLTDPNHPFLVVASNSLSDELAAELKAKYFPHAIQGELKHTNLRTRRSSNVVNFIGELAKHHSTKVKFFALHKQFALVIKVYQYWIEDKLSDKARTDGYNLLLANLIYADLKTATGDEKTFATLLEVCKEMLSEHNYSKCLEFWKMIGELSAARKDLPFLKILAQANNGLGPDFYEQIFIADELDLKRLSVHFTTVLALISFWQNGFPKHSFEIYHDGGSEMQKYCNTSTWKNLLDPAQSRVYQGPQHRVTFPLRVTKADFTLSSKDCLQIQLCDIVAGATAEVCKTIMYGPRNVNYVSDLLNAGILTLGADVVMPNIREALDVHERLRERP